MNPLLAAHVLTTLTQHQAQRLALLATVHPRPIWEATDDRLEAIGLLSGGLPTDEGLAVVDARDAQLAASSDDWDACADEEDRRAAEADHFDGYAE